MIMDSSKQIEIWSDIVCPFCYIGKHQVEEALLSFPEARIELIWRSYQLNPDEKTDPTLNSTDHLAQSKGWTKEQTEQAQEMVCRMGESCSIDFKFGTVKVINSLDGHRLLHYSKQFGLQTKLKERLFKAHFEEGKNVADHAVLVQIAVELGMMGEDVDQMLGSRKFIQEVHEDLIAGVSLGLRGVPYFVFDGRFAVSGAQGVEGFRNAISEMLKS
jgi:predicted DsbA family dithiol-disulfide isomerase